MKGRIFAIRKKFRGVVTVIIDVPTEDYKDLEVKKDVEITQENQKV